MKTTKSFSILLALITAITFSTSAFAQGKGKKNNGGPSNDCTICSDETNDTFRGTPEEETLLGLGGMDTLYGLGGIDNIEGGDDPDVLFADDDPALLEHGVADLDDSGGRMSGGTGNDIMHGDNGPNVVMFGNEGNDTIFGHGGNDDIWAFPGADLIDGGDGLDIIRVNTDSMQYIVNYMGTDPDPGNGLPDPDPSKSVYILIDGVPYTVKGLTIRDVMNDDDASNTVTVASMEGVRMGTSNDDYYCGGDADEWFGGGRGNDFTSAGAGIDFIGADRGVDILIGGPGEDILRGAEQGDYFVFFGPDFASGENDIIEDFNASADTIVLVNGWVDGDVTTAPDDGGRKPDSIVPVAFSGGQSGTITTWDVKPPLDTIITGDPADWIDVCSPIDLSAD